MEPEYLEYREIEKKYFFLKLGGMSEYRMIIIGF